jgi:hypothetical protein
MTTMRTIATNGGNMPAVTATIGTEILEREDPPSERARV